MNNSFRCIVAFLLLLLFGIACPTYATPNELKFISLEVAPWAYYDKKTGSLKGVFPDVIRELEHRLELNISVSLSSHAFNRINRELESGRADCTMVVSSPAREIFTLKGAKVYDLPIGILGKKEVNFDKQRLLKKVSTSTLKLLANRHSLTDIDMLSIEIDPTYEVGIKKLKYGRIDAVAGAIPTIKYLAKKYDIDKSLGVPHVLFNEPVYLQCSKKSNNLIFFEKINNKIEEMRKEGFLMKIANKHSWR